MRTRQEANLKKVLGLSDVLGFVFGQIVGAGVLILTGIGIGLTGKGIVVAFIITGLINCITVLPMAQLASAIPVTGAGYRYSSMLMGPKWGFLWQIGIIVSKITIALFALSFAEYLQGLFPAAPIVPTALIMLTFFYVLNLVGIKTAATTQKYLVLIKISGLLVFAAWGISSIDITSFASTEAIMPNGLDGLLQAVGIVAYASYGGVMVAELGGEMKNPSRDIPLGILIGTIGSTLIYALIALVASGTLPIAEVANKPLSLVAKSVLPEPAYLYFMIAGAVISIGTTLNAVFQWVTKGMIVACEDGWLPRKLGEVNVKFGTPHYALTFFYILGVVTILSGISLGDIARLGFGFLLIVSIIPVLGCAFLPKKYPEQYAKALFRMKPSILYPCIGLAVVIMIGQVFYVLKGLPTNLKIAEGIIVALSIIYVNIAGNYLKKKQSTATELTSVIETGIKTPD